MSSTLLAVAPVTKGLIFIGMLVVICIVLWPIAKRREQELTAEREGHLRIVSPQVRALHDHALAAAQAGQALTPYANEGAANQLRDLDLTRLGAVTDFAVSFPGRDFERASLSVTYTTRVGDEAAGLIWKVAHTDATWKVMSVHTPGKKVSGSDNAASLMAMGAMGSADCGAGL